MTQPKVLLVIIINQLYTYRIFIQNAHDMNRNLEAGHPLFIA